MAKRKAEKRAGRQAGGGDTRDEGKRTTSPAGYDDAKAPRDTSAAGAQATESSGYDPAGPPPLPHATMGGGASQPVAGYEPEERSLGGGAASAGSSGVQSFADDRELGGGASASASAAEVPQRGMGGGAGAEAGTGDSKDKDEHGRRRSHHHFGLAGR